MFDIQVLGIVLTVIFFSLMSILLISKLPNSKSFDEMLEEKRQFKAQLIAAAQSTEKSKKELHKKGKKQGYQKQNKSKKLVHTRNKDSEHSADPSDTQSDKSEDSSVEEREFIETEAFPLTDTVSIKHASKNNRKNKNKGILINKSDPVLVKDSPVEELNHFEEIHPKDVVELHRGGIEEINDTQPIKKGNNKKGKKQISVPVDVIVENKDHEETVNVATTKDKSNSKQKRKVEHTESTQPSYMEDDLIRTLLRTLNTAELTKHEIQILIDFLLNKQHDTTAKDPTEWTEGKSDMLQKLKKQLQDRDKQLQEEQQASAALQAKLRDLRSELNTEKSQFNATIKAHVEELNLKKKEFQNLNAEIHYSNEKHNAEKLTLSQQCQQLQAKLIQLKSESSNSQEAIQKLQQLTVQNEKLKQELHNREQTIKDIQRAEGEHRQFIDGLQQSLAEREQKLREFEHLLAKKDGDFKFIESELRQCTQDIATREQEVQRLHSEVNKKSEEMELYLKTCENLKVQLTEVQSKASNQNHLEDANKVEIKNLQNALDSCTKELNSVKLQLDDANLELTEIKQQSNRTTSETSQQIEEMKILVSNLKASMLDKDIQVQEYENTIRRLHDEQAEHKKEIEKQKQKNNSPQTSEEIVAQAVKTEELRIREMFCKMLPEMAPSEHAGCSNWIEYTSSFIRDELAKTRERNNSNSTNNLNNHNEENSCNSVKQVNDSEVNGSEVNDKAIEKLLLQNAQLQRSLDEYKSIVSDTEQVLHNLEAKVAEKDTYWLSIVQSKDDEINSLKPSVQS